MPEQQWDAENIAQLFNLPFMELIYLAQTAHREYFKLPEMELCTLLNIKTGACPENCAYCPQSGHYDTGLQKEQLLSVEDIIKKATLAKENGATRFCMGAAWRNPPKKDFPKIIEIIKAVKSLKLETCMTLGMLSD